MKERKKLRPNPHKLERSAIARPSSETGLQSKQANYNLVLQRSAQFIASYNNLLRGPSQNFGDADSYFKKTLRNYDDFDFWRHCHFTTFDKSSSPLKSPRKSTRQRKPSHSKSKRKTAYKMSDEENETTEGEDEEIQQVNEILQKTSQELDLVEEENQLILHDIENAPDLSPRTSQDIKPDSDQLNPPELKRSSEPDSIQQQPASPGQPGSVHSAQPGSARLSQHGSPLPSQPPGSARPSQQGSARASLPSPAPSGQPGAAASLPPSQLGSAYPAPSEFPSYVYSAQPAAAQMPSCHTRLPVLGWSHPGPVGSVHPSQLVSAASMAPPCARPFVHPGTHADGVLGELEDAERDAKATANAIFALKSRVGELLARDRMTDAEAAELELKNADLRDQMALFEARTRRIQELIARSDMAERVPRRAPPARHTEDVLPRMILYGARNDNVPNIILCDGSKKATTPPAACFADCTARPQEVIPQYQERLNMSYTMQEKLAAENADLECMRYKLQEDLVNKDQTLECLQRKLGNLQNEMRLVAKENASLNEKIRRMQKEEGSRSRDKKKCYGREAASDMAAKLQEYSDNTYALEHQLADIECDVKCIQEEIAAVQKEREHLEQHRKVMALPPCSGMSCVAPCFVSCCMPKQPKCIQSALCVTPKSAGESAQVREFREMYDRLQDDYKSKLTEVAGLRADNEKLRAGARDADEQRRAADERARECERVAKQFRGDNAKLAMTKEQIVEQEQQLAVAKQRFRDAQDELEELRALLQDQKEQLDDYRNKYLEAQQQVEEQTRQIDMMEMENTRVNEQVNLEIQRVKNQFQEKLHELTPLPDILKTTQLKLHDAQQMHLMAEKNNESLGQELQMYKDKCAQIAAELDQALTNSQLGADERAQSERALDELRARVATLLDENATVAAELMRAEDAAALLEKRSESQAHEIAQLDAQLAGVREESARQVARIKERCETVRRSMQSQVGDLERQLAQSRAAARAAQRDRDEIRQKMQAQINNLNENFEDAQGRIRNLQSHVNYLKHSYPSVFAAEMPIGADEGDACNC